jgi:DNA ligase-1
MVKMLETDASFYEPSRRSMNWLKVAYPICRTRIRDTEPYSPQLKKDYLSGVGDSLDLVVVGGYFGKGKRTAWYGAFLLGCYDSDSETYQTICKLGTGFSEEVLKTLSEQLKELELTTCRADVDAGGAKPDVWFEPKVVWEVLAADLSLSPIYAAAKGLVS